MPHYLRFCRALALLSGTPLLIGACSSTGDTSQSNDAASDGAPACDGGCGVTVDAGGVSFDAGFDSAYDGHPVGVAPGDAAADTADDAEDTAYDGHPVGVSIDAGPDFGGGGGGPQSLPDLPYLG
jgi:hypothetical protein